MLDLVNWIEKAALKYPGATLDLLVDERDFRIAVCCRLQTDASARTILSAEPSTNVVCKNPLQDLPSRDNKNRQQPFYSIPELADRWRCSRGTVYNRLRFAGAKVLDFASAGKKGKKLVSASTVFQIESKHRKALP